MSLEPGSHHGRYTVVRLLGQGATGEVYLVRHQDLDRREALKVLVPQLARDPRYVRRLRSEARVANRLHHPNIVSIHDFGQLPDGHVYLAMELAEGDRLDQLLAHRRPEITWTLRLLDQLADAMTHAHELGIVHRDLKPANLIVGDDGRGGLRMKVLDFGLARRAGSGGRDSVGVLPPTIDGTPTYMAPEQARGGGADPRSDIYSFGCVAFEMLTGRPPFIGSSAIDILRQHQTSTVPAPSAAGGVGIPPELDAMILRCLAKDPEQRLSNATELRGEIARISRAAVIADGVDLPITVSNEQELTELSSMGWMMAQESAAPTTGMSGAQYQRAFQDATLELAEALIDAGRANPTLLRLVVHLRDVMDQRAELIDRSLALGRSVTELERSGSERERSLRYAIGALDYELGRCADDPAVPDLRYQLSELRTRLITTSAERRHAIDAALLQQVELTAKIAVLDESHARATQVLAREAEMIASRNVDDAFSGQRSRLAGLQEFGRTQRGF